MPHGFVASARGLLLGLAALLVSLGAAAQSGQDATLREAMVAESIAQYRGACACPESTMRNGRRCGAHSAWSKGGGQKPLCYASDVNPQMLEAYKTRKGVR